MRAPPPRRRDTPGTPGLGAWRLDREQSRLTCAVPSATRPSRHSTATSPASARSRLPPADRLADAARPRRAAGHAFPLWTLPGNTAPAGVAGGRLARAARRRGRVRRWRRGHAGRQLPWGAPDCGRWRWWRCARPPRRRPAPTTAVSPAGAAPLTQAPHAARARPRSGRSEDQLVRAASPPASAGSVPANRQYDVGIRTAEAERAHSATAGDSARSGQTSRRSSPSPATGPDRAWGWASQSTLGASSTGVRSSAVFIRPATPAAPPVTHVGLDRSHPQRCSAARPRPRTVASAPTSIGPSRSPVPCCLHDPPGRVDPGRRVGRPQHRLLREPVRAPRPLVRPSWLTHRP